MGIEGLDKEVLDHLNQPVFAVNRAYEIVYANAALAAHLGVPLDAIIGRPCYTLIHRSDAPCRTSRGITCPVREAFSTGAQSSSIHKHLVGTTSVVAEIVATPLAGRDLVIWELRDVSHLLGLVNGFLSICSSCKRIRDASGTWHHVERYVAQHSGADFSHGLCPVCRKKLYPGLP